VVVALQGRPIPDTAGVFVRVEARVEVVREFTDDAPTFDYGELVGGQTHIAVVRAEKVAAYRSGGVAVAGMVGRELQRLSG
jgi:hypothetical protein